jgi:hypothetical protein
VLRLDGAIPYDTLEELTEAELLAAWDEYVAYSEAKDRAMKAQVPQQRK